MKQQLSPMIVGVIIAIVVVILGGGIWYFMAQSDKSGPDMTSKIIPGQAQRPAFGGGGAATQKKATGNAVQ